MIPKGNPSAESCECFINTSCTAPTQSRPCYISPCANLPMTPEQAFATRYSNFYNGYNIDYHNDGSWWQSKHRDDCHDRPNRAKGQTVDGKGTCCDPKPKEDLCECLNSIIDQFIQDTKRKKSKHKDDCHDRPFRATGQTVDGKGTCCHTKPKKDDCHDRPNRAKGQTVDGKGTCCDAKPKEDQCECLNSIVDKLIQDSKCKH